MTCFSASGRSSNFADQDSLLDEALGEDDLLLVFQIDADVANRKGGRVQSKIQSLTEESWEEDASGADIEADRVAAGMHSADNARARSNDILDRERRRLEE